MSPAGQPPRNSKQRNKISHNALQEALGRVAQDKKVLEARLQDMLLTDTIRGEQKERERIARNLHDELGTNLNIARLNFAKRALSKKISKRERELIEEVIF